MKSNRRWQRTLMYMVALAFTVIILVPYAWLVLSSFKNRSDAFSIPPKFFFSPTLENYKVALLDKGYLHNVFNSSVVALGATACALLIGVPSAYGFARFRLPGKQILLFYLLASRMLPTIVLALPLFIFFANERLIDTYRGIIVAHVTFDLPFVVWMMKGFFDGLPQELYEAAIIDGTNQFGAFVRVALPLSAGGLAATAIFCIINSWNEFLFALLLTGRNTSTLPVIIPTMLTPYGTYWGQIAAMGTVTTVPVLIFAFSVQRYLVRGLAGGAVRG